MATANVGAQRRFAGDALGRAGRRTARMTA
ncbi:unnamed protein product [Burkholderia pseudomallei]|nr:unnamed protein product [Burkholderia pseudomallei]